MTEFESFLSYFPEITPPITLTEDSIDHINATNDALPYHLLNSFINNWEGEEDLALTEYIPCLKLPKNGKFNTIIYWKASLLRYDFIMATIDDIGNLIQRKNLCGTLVEDNVIKKSVANIDEDYIIHIVAGAHKTNEMDYDASYSQSFTMEVMANGEIVFINED
jgi:hypothetical protein